MKLLQLFEDSSRSKIVWLDDDPSLVAKYILDWNKNAEIGDSDTTHSLSAFDIKVAQAELKHLITGDFITAYRGMNINRPNSLSQGSNLGQSWSYKIATARPYNAADNHVLTFSAKLPVSSIDWLATIALFGSGENEIRLRTNAPFKLEWIKDVHGYEVRKDLFGQEFFA